MTASVLGIGATASGGCAAAAVRCRWARASACPAPLLTSGRIVDFVPTAATVLLSLALKVSSKLITPLSPKDEHAIAALARTPGLSLAQSNAVLIASYARMTGDPVASTQALVKLYLEGNAEATARAVLQPKTTAAPPRALARPKPAVTKPAPQVMTLAQLKALADESAATLARLQTTHAAREAARTATAREVAQRAESRSRIETAFGIYPKRGVTFDGVVQRFG